MAAKPAPAEKKNEKYLQSSDSPPPQSSRLFKFKSQWFHKWKWLEYDVVKDLAYCYLCITTYKSSMDSISKLSPLLKGYGCWQNAAKTFSTHEQSDLHRTAVELENKKSYNSVNVLNVSRRPYQPIKFDFPLREYPPKEKHSFQAQWFKKWKWLHYDDDNDLVFCHMCMIGVKLGILSDKRKATLAYSGLSNWKGAMSYFIFHEASSLHIRAVALKEKIFKIAFDGSSSKDSEESENDIEVMENMEGDIPRKPFQPHEYDFPQQEFGSESQTNKRRFREKWFTIWTWLHYDPDDDSAYCYFCMMGAKAGILSHVKKAMLINTGFRDWRNVSRVFNYHENSDIHKMALQLKEDIYKIIFKKEKIQTEDLIEDMAVEMKKEEVEQNLSFCEELIDATPFEEIVQVEDYMKCIAGKIEEQEPKGHILADEGSGSLPNLLDKNDGLLSDLLENNFEWMFGTKSKACEGRVEEQDEIETALDWSKAAEENLDTTLYQMMDSVCEPEDRVPYERDISIENTLTQKIALKILAIGDAGCGKKRLLQKLMHKQEPIYTPQPLFPLHVDGFDAYLSIDTISDLDENVPLFRSYKYVDVLLMVFNINSLNSLLNIINKWMPEVYNIYPQDTPLLSISIYKCV